MKRKETLEEAYRSVYIKERMAADPAMQQPVADPAMQQPVADPIMQQDQVDPIQNFVSNLMVEDIPVLLNAIAELLAGTYEQQVDPSVQDAAQIDPAMQQPVQ